MKCGKWKYHCGSLVPYEFCCLWVGGGTTTIADVWPHSDEQYGKPLCLVVGGVTTVARVDNILSSEVLNITSTQM